VLLRETPSVQVPAADGAKCAQNPESREYTSLMVLRHIRGMKNQYRLLQSYLDKSTNPLQTTLGRKIVG
jgi:hypothetical protein